MKTLRLVDAARADLEQIAAYTERTWGGEQKRRCLGLIRRRFERLRSEPCLGRRRDDIQDGCRSMPCGRHQIFYRDTEAMVIVLRILHDRMDVHRHLSSAEDEL